MIKVLKSKLKEVIVTDANPNYEGSLTLDPLLMAAANLIKGESVHVNSRDGKSRIETYVIPGIEGSGQVELNGGAANHFRIGDIVHVNAWRYLSTPHGLASKHLIVYTGERNKIIEVKSE